MNKTHRRQELLLLAAIVLVGGFFRTFRLDSVPRGMIADEAQRGLAALAIGHNGYYPVFLKEPEAYPMCAYWLAIVFRFLGASLLTARAGAALIGIATVPVFYFLVRALFYPRSRRSGQMVAVSATFFLATSYWHTVYSRVAREMILLPFFAILVAYCLVKAWRSGRPLYFILCGVSLGLGLYTYASSSLLPLLVFVPLGYCIWREKGSLRSHFVNLLLLSGTCLVVATPLALFAVREPAVFTARAREVTLVNPELTGPSPVVALVASSARTAATFVIRGDPSPVHNPASRPVLDPVASIWFVLGLCVTLRKWREPAHFLLLTWLLIMCLPAAITVLPSADFSRAIGAVPVVSILPALGMVTAWEWLESRKAAHRLVTIFGTLVVAMTLLFTAATAYLDYFTVWETREDLRQGYDGAYTEAAAMMNETRVPDSVWVLPLTAVAQSGYGADHFDFLYKGDTPYYTPRVDEGTAAEELSRILQAGHKALVVDWKGYVPEKAYEAISADPKHLISFLMQKYGRELDRRSYEAFDVVTYRVPRSPSFSIAEQFEPLAVHFGNELILTGMAFGGSSLQETSTPQEVERRQLPSGKSAWLVLRWRATREPNRSYKVAVFLEDQDRHIAGQVDKLLLSNDLHTTDDWRIGQEEIDYYTLPSWNGSAPGSYKLAITVYDADSQDVLYLRHGARSYELGTVEIVKPLVSGAVEPAESVADEQEEMARGIRLLGYDLPRKEPSPGDQLSVALYWQATRDVDREYLLSVQLTNEQGLALAEKPGAPVYGTYHTVEWTEGEVLKDWHDLDLPPDIPSGQYELLLQVLESGEIVGQVGLGSIEVRGRPHLFDVPDIQHTLEARLGDSVLFLGYDLSSEEPKPGDALTLVLYWQASDEMEISYTVFTHLLGADGRIWAQMDSIPLRGEAPTTSWLAGEVLVDEYQLALDPQAPPGSYEIEIGMYDSSSGQRLPVTVNGTLIDGDRLLLAEIHVTK